MEDDQGQVVGRKPEARLIISGGFPKLWLLKRFIGVM